MRLVFVCGVALLALNTASAKAETPEQVSFRMARATVRMSLTERFCSQFYVVDKVKTSELAAAMLKEGVDRFGQAQMKYAVDGADAEFAALIAKQGAAVWCPAQKKIYRQMGLPDLIGGPLPR